MYLNIYLHEKYIKENDILNRFDKGRGLIFFPLGFLLINFDFPTFKWNLRDDKTLKNDIMLFIVYIDI